MTIYETIKAAISVKQAAKHYGLNVNRNGISERNDYGYGCILSVYEKIKARLSAENICISDTTVRPRKDRYL